MNFIMNITWSKFVTCIICSIYTWNKLNLFGRYFQIFAIAKISYRIVAIGFCILSRQTKINTKCIQNHKRSFDARKR